MYAVTVNRDNRHRGKVNDLVTMAPHVSGPQIPDLENEVR